MAFVNENYLNLKASYLFSEIAKRVKAYSHENPDASLVPLGIGDVTRPLSKSVIKALHSAVDEMGDSASFHGYGPEQGYDFLKAAIIKHYAERGVEVASDEIFVSDGAKSDTGNIGDIFAQGNTVAITDPVYPVYVDTNIMAGREIKLMNCEEKNGFTPSLPDFKADIIYLCSPNNPTGAVMTKEQLKAFVDYAKENGSIILFDAAYEAYIGSPELPHSIFEIEGARDCAIEFCSFSKTAGFTGTRCAYTVIPKTLCGKTKSGKEENLNHMWNRRHTTKFNGVPYIVQRAAAAVYSDEGMREAKETISYYMENARIIRTALKELGLTCFGGENAPYIWLKCPKGMLSWEFFDLLLKKANVIGTPGSGFGTMGEGYFRLTAFGTRENTIEAVNRIGKLIKNL